MGLNRLAPALRWADTLSEAGGRVAAALAVALVALAFGLVLARYGAGVGSVAAQEAVLWLHASLFLLGLGYTLRHDGHVRVDVFSQRWSAPARARVTLVATLALLLPFCVFMLAMSWDYVAASWAAREGSRDPGGLPGWYLLKALVPVSATLLLLQGLAETTRALGRATSRQEP